MSCKLGAGAEARRGAAGTRSHAGPARRDAGRIWPGRRAARCQPARLGVGSREETGLAEGGRAARGKPGRRREGSGGGGVPRAPRSAATPTPTGGLSRYLPAGKLRASPGLSGPPASGARKRPHIAGGSAEWAGGARFPTPVLRCLCLLLLRRRKLVRSLSCGGTREAGRAGGLSNGRSATGRGRRGRIRRGGGGGCHGQPSCAEARAREAAAPR